jgi:hypothetical protein
MNWPATVLADNNPQLIASIITTYSHRKLRPAFTVLFFPFITASWEFAYHRYRKSIALTTRRNVPIPIKTNASCDLRRNTAIASGPRDDASPLTEMPQW